MSGFTESAWRKIFKFFKGPRKAAGGTEARLLGNILNGFLCGQKKLLGVMDPYLVDMVQKGEAGILFKK